MNFQVPNNNLGHSLNFPDPRALPLTLYQHLQESDAGQALYLFLLLLLLLLLLFFMPRLVWECWIGAIDGNPSLLWGSSESGYL